MPRKDPVQLANARAMRSEMTPPEAKLWHHLRARRFHGVKFSRQVLVGPYIADFAAREVGLVIELDGDSHGSQVTYDERRTAMIEGQGYKVIRFTNRDVLENVDGVLEMIGMALNTAPLPNRGQSHAPLTTPGGERE